MTAETICPKCDGILTKNDNSYRCNGCETSFKQEVLCPDCDAELEKMKACGSVSYFCNSCKQLKSRSTIITRYTEIKAS